MCDSHSFLCVNLPLGVFWLSLWCLVGATGIHRNVGRIYMASQIFCKFSFLC